MATTSSSGSSADKDAHGDLADIDIEEDDLDLDENIISLDDIDEDELDGAAFKAALLQAQQQYLGDLAEDARSRKGYVSGWGRGSLGGVGVSGEVDAGKEEEYRAQGAGVQQSTQGMMHRHSSS